MSYVQGFGLKDIGRARRRAAPTRKKGQSDIDAWCVQLTTLGAKSKWLDSWKDVRRHESNVLKHKNPKGLSGKRMSRQDLEKAIRHLLWAVKWAK